VRSGALKLTEFLRLTSLGPAGILGLDHLYGLLEVNYRANLVVIDLNGWGRFSGTYSKARYCTRSWRAFRRQSGLSLWAASWPQRRGRSY